MVDSLLTDYTRYAFNLKERAMLDFAVKLTLTPGQMKREDAEALRQAGWNDNGILEIVHVISYYNYINRIADGLGVEP